MTRAQRAHAKEQRALLRLRRAAVRYSVLGDENPAGTFKDDSFALAFADLTAACDAYRNTLTAREARRLSKLLKLAIVAGALALYGCVADVPPAPTLPRVYSCTADVLCGRARLPITVEECGGDYREAALAVQRNTQAPSACAVVEVQCVETAGRCLP